MTPPRYTRIAGYLMMAAGGGTAFAIPAPSIQAATGWVVYLWAAFLLAGGALCAYGAVTDRWIGEYTGLPLISSAFGVYAVVLVLGAAVRTTAAALAFGAVALVLLDRWYDVNRVRVAATDQAEHGGGDRGTGT